MVLNYEGSVSLATAIPVAATAAATLTTNLAPPQADVTARLAAQTTLSLAPPTVIADLVTQLTAQLGALNALITAGVVVLPPTASANVEIAAQLQVILDALDAGLAFAADLTATLGVGGIHWYTYAAGAANGIGGELAGVLSSGVPAGGGPSEEIDAVVLVANTAGGKAALAAIFG